MMITNRMATHTPQVSDLTLERLRELERQTRLLREGHYRGGLMDAALNGGQISKAPASAQGFQSPPFWVERRAAVSTVPVRTIPDAPTVTGGSR